MGRSFYCIGLTDDTRHRHTLQNFYGAKHAIKKFEPTESNLPNRTVIIKRQEEVKKETKNKKIKVCTKEQLTKKYQANI